MMEEGAKWQIFVPPELGFGERGAGSAGPNETLIMEIELLKVNHGQNNWVTALMRVPVDKACLVTDWDRWVDVLGLNEVRRAADR